MMMMLPLAKVSFFWTLVVALWVLIAVALILIVLIQKGRGGGISAAFGGGGANSLLGTKTGDFLTWVTISLVALFLVMAVVMGKFMRPDGTSNLIDTAVQTPQTPPAETPAADVIPPTEQPAGTVAEEAKPVVEGAAEKAAETTEVAPPAATETPAPPVAPVEAPAPVQN